jgi:nicotinamidase/pyrazinamidase
MTDRLGARPDDVLLVVDVQNDFCPGGALEVAEGDAVVPLVNRLMTHFDHSVLTQDWHPAGHISFASSHPGREPFQEIELVYGAQTLWPDHCVQGSVGAAFHRDLDRDRAEAAVRKGFHQNVDSYSAFFENDHATPTGLGGYLAERGLKRVVIAGLAYDFCVRFSAEDARTLGLETWVVTDASRAVALPGTVEATEASFDALGVKRITSGEILQ